MNEINLEKLKEFLDEGGTPKTIEQIAFKLGWSYNYCYTTLKVLIAGGEIRKLNRANAKLSGVYANRLK